MRTAAHRAFPHARAEPIQVRNLRRLDMGEPQARPTVPTVVPRRVPSVKCATARIEACSGVRADVQTLALTGRRRGRDRPAGDCAPTMCRPCQSPGWPASRSRPGPVKAVPTMPSAGRPASGPRSLGVGAGAFAKDTAGTRLPGSDAPSGGPAGIHLSSQAFSMRQEL
jgi:hypothetical protein